MKFPCGRASLKCRSAGIFLLSLDIPVGGPPRGSLCGYHLMDLCISLSPTHNVSLSLVLALPLSLYLSLSSLFTASLKFQVPCTVLFNKSPNYNFLRNFGCSCYPFLRPYNKHKLDFRSHDVCSLVIHLSQRLQVSLS